MMTRIVRMGFKPESVETFLKVFNENREKIGSFPGCYGVRLLNDVHSPTVFFTYSHWTGPDALEAYRVSELFEAVWAKTKIHFNEKPQAWSLYEK